MTVCQKLFTIPGMDAMLDATCPCGKRLGWRGSVTDRPACSRCGHRPPDAELAAEQAKVDEVRRLIGLHPRDASPADLTRMRELAGLSVGQAAKALGVEWHDLAGLEAGDLTLGDTPLAQKMAEAYGCGY